jgi:TRAP-type transport system periplasmic protein
MRQLTRRTATRYGSLDNARGYPRFRGPRWTWPGRTGRLVGKGGACGQRRCGEWEESGLGRWQLRAAVIVAAMGVLGGIAARADSARHFSFAYDQPHSTGYGIAADLFNSKLMEMSHGSMAIDQFPGAQLGQEPQMLQKIRTGDIDFMISSTANAATVAPESGVLSIHYLFRSEDQLIKAIGDPRLIAAVREMFDATVKDGHVLALATLGLRDLYGKRPVAAVDDLKGHKVRVQATPTEDTLFPAYGAQTVHMPFGSVYTSLQTGVVDFAENGVNVYDSNKHYEVAPVLSMTEHEANNSVIWVSDKLWASLSDEQKDWVQAAAAEVGLKQPAEAIALEHKSLARLQKLGVKVVTGVDKASFIKIAEPLQDKLAKGLGPHAEKILQVCRSIE